MLFSEMYIYGSVIFNSALCAKVKIRDFFFRIFLQGRAKSIL